MKIKKYGKHSQMLWLTERLKRLTEPPLASLVDYQHNQINKYVLQTLKHVIIPRLVHLDIICADNVK